MTGSSAAPASACWRRARRAVASLAILLAGAGGQAAWSAALPILTTTDQQMSPTEVSALQGGANGHPYATLALLYLLRDTADTSSVQDGALYLESIPEVSLTSLLQGSADRDAISTLLGMLLWNPYSPSKFFVQVSWSVRSVPSGTKVVEFHTQLLLEEGGAFAHPPLESDVAVLLRNGDVWFLTSAAGT
jgi:hypothetical protein